jgi:hypothetical protein
MKMYKFRDKMMTKSGTVTQTLAKLFLTYEPGQKIPTVTAFSEMTGTSRGTVYASLRQLSDGHAIQLEHRGHMGSVLVRKDVRLLLEYADISAMIGTMPLPYTRACEGLATGLVAGFESQYGLNLFMTYIHGARNRISFLLSDRCDLAVLSYAAYEDYQKDHADVLLIHDFGPHSYAREPVILFHDAHVHEVQDGMKVAVDPDYVDQAAMTRQICAGRKVSYLSIDYSQAAAKVLSGEADAAVWDRSDIAGPYRSLHLEPLPITDKNTNAVLIVSAAHPETGTLLQQTVDFDAVLEIQKKVLEGTVTPSY